jgi:hypothetical protein
MHVPHYPRMDQRLLRGHTFPRIHMEQSANEVHRLDADVHPVLGLELVLTEKDGLASLVFRVAVERQVAAKHYVSDDADRPKVARPVVTLEEDLRRDVLQRPEEGGHGSVDNLVMPPRYAEVDDLDWRILFGGLEQYVLRLDVPVDDALSVHVGYGAQDLVNRPRGLVLRETWHICSAVRRFLDNPVEQLPAVAKLCDNVYILFVLEDVNLPYDVLVPQISHQLNLAREAASLDGWMALANRLDGAPLTGGPVDAFPHGAVLTGAEYSRINLILGLDVAVSLRNYESVLGLVLRLVLRPRRPPPPPLPATHRAKLMMVVAARRQAAVAGGGGGRWWVVAAAAAKAKAADCVLRPGRRCLVACGRMVDDIQEETRKR